MRVFVYEYLCSAAAANSPETSLQTEGWAMLSAIAEDLARCPGVETLTLLDPRLASAIGNWPTAIISYLSRPDTEEQTFRALAAAADFSLIIAPEFDGILEQRCRWVEEEGGHLLGPSSDAVRLTADKLTLACHLQAHNISTPAAIPLPSSLPVNSVRYPLVCKPRYGAGSQATFLVQDEEGLARALLQAEVEGWSSEFILQPYVPGLAVSVALLCGAAQWISLPAVQQYLSTDGRFHYRGGRLPLAEHWDRRARRLAVRAAQTVKGVHGYFGVDMVLGDTADGSADMVIEINPRLTTSYVGLRELAHFNLAEALLAVATGVPTPPLELKSKDIQFTSNGRILS
jgi:tyramine---L-glutamate ligase